MPDAWRQPDPQARDKVKVAKPLADILEDEWDAQLFRGPKSVARATGWKLSYHTLRSKGSRSGFPDRVLVRERVIFVELKREKTKPTDDQVEWLDGLAGAGAEVYLWRPSDLDEIALVLGKRWTFDSRTRSLERKDTFLLPKSIWIPGRGRRDSSTEVSPPVESQLGLETGFTAC